jgi:hypothetical protein
MRIFAKKRVAEFVGNDPAQNRLYTSLLLRQAGNAVGIHVSHHSIFSIG